MGKKIGKNISGKYSHRLADAKQSPTDAHKTPSKIAIQGTSKITSTAS